MKYLIKNLRALLYRKDLSFLSLQTFVYLRSSVSFTF